MPTNPADLRLADLYSGAGGLSAGFLAARIQTAGGPKVGFALGFAVDRSRTAMQTFRENHLRGAPQQTLELVAPCQPIEGDPRHKIPRLTRRRVLEATGGEPIDIVIGGPNCQGVSTAGLRNPRDRRNRMFLEFRRLVRELNPEWFVFENVPGLMHANNRPLLRAIMASFEELGYEVAADMLLAADFGVAQLRYRLFVVGNRIGRPIRFPRRKSREYRTVEDVIGHLRDVPPVDADDPGSTTPPWPNHEAPKPRGENVARIATVPQGGDWRSIPIRLLPERNFATRASDQAGTYGRLSWNRPAFTITGSASNITAGTFAHPDRHGPISVREAALLQGFPPKYTFSGSAESGYSQVGNAVPPPLATAVAETILRCHFAPESADDDGRQGRITVNLLDDVSKGQAKFPSLTPRHPLERPPRVKVRRAQGADPKAFPPKVRFQHKPEKRPKLAADDPSHERLRREVSWPQNVRAAKRARAILGYYDGKPVRELTGEANVSTATIKKWILGFEEGGVEGWRAYHTGIEHLADDPDVLRRLREAVEAIRAPDELAVDGGPEGRSRLHMNRKLAELVQKYGDLSVDGLIGTAEKKVGAGLGTMYVGDLLAICNVLDVHACAESLPTAAPGRAIQLVIPLEAEALLRGIEAGGGVAVLTPTS